MSLIKRLSDKMRHSFFLFGILSIAWFLFKTGIKPDRACYPCQRASAAAGSLWLTWYVLPILSMMRLSHISRTRNRNIVLAGILAGLVFMLFAGGSVLDSTGDLQATEAGKADEITLALSDRQASITDASDIFVINGTDGNDGGVKELIDLMQKHGSSFYAKNDSPGIIGSNDIVIIKVNSQWDERGGTNTDLVKELIQAILDHPQGFTGEVVIADNGQAQYGSAGSGGNLDYERQNALDTSQSMKDVAGSFSGSNVSAYLWDEITNRRVEEYSDGDTMDGFVVQDYKDPDTGIVVTYPKFRTKNGANLSFKLGVWDHLNKTYDSGRLKVINVPVLKTHMTYGVTACVKHYMGVTSDKLSREMGGRSHNSVGLGGMGTEMAETRFPALNVLDAIWINANPRKGPRTFYSEATEISTIAASTDPVALDYWATKEILMPAARAKGYSDLSSIDPDDRSPGSFGTWLKLSMEEMRKAGYMATMDDEQINVSVAGLATK